MCDTGRGDAAHSERQDWQDGMRQVWDSIGQLVQVAAARRVARRRREWHREQQRQHGQQHAHAARGGVEQEQQHGAGT